MKKNKKIINLFLFIITSSLVTGCFVSKETLFGNKFKIESSTNKITISHISVVNNQLIIQGTHLDVVNKVEIEGSSFDENFKIDTISSSELIVSGLRAVSFGVGKMFNLILSDANGSTTFPINFTINNGSVTGAMLNSMGAQHGYVLKYLNNVWTPAPLASSQVYEGTWDASTNTPMLESTSPLSGDYYIVSKAGNYNSVDYEVGDWIMHDGLDWDKITSGIGTKLSLSGKN